MMGYNDPTSTMGNPVKNTDLRFAAAFAMIAAVSCSTAKAAPITFQASGNLYGQSTTNPGVYDVLKGTFSEFITFNAKDANFSTINFSSSLGSYNGQISAAPVENSSDFTQITVLFYAFDNLNNPSSFGVQNYFTVDKAPKGATVISSLDDALPSVSDFSNLRFIASGERYRLDFQSYQLNGTLSFGVSSVPLPPSVALFGAALALTGIAGYALRRRGAPKIA